MAPGALPQPVPTLTRMRILLLGLLLVGLPLASFAPAASADPSVTTPTYTCEFWGASVAEVGCPPLTGAVGGQTLVFHDHDTEAYNLFGTPLTPLSCGATPVPPVFPLAWCVHRLIVVETVLVPPAAPTVLINACVRPTFTGDITVSTPAPNTPLGPYKITMKASAVYTWYWSRPEPGTCSTANDVLPAGGGVAITNTGVRPIPTPRPPGACGDVLGSTITTSLNVGHYPSCNGTLPKPDCWGVYDEIPLSGTVYTPFIQGCGPGTVPDGVCIGVIREPPGTYDEACLHTHGPCLLDEDGGTVDSRNEKQYVERSDVLGNTYWAPGRDFQQTHYTCLLAETQNGP